MKTVVILLISLFILTGRAYAQPEIDGELSTVGIDHYNFSDTDKDASIWSAMYIASNDKIYIGLCTHADAANVYEFDISTRKMKHLANLTELLDERGKGTWTNGKIHVKMQELDGYIYFGSFCEDNGPPAIDSRSYQGPFWFKVSMETGEVITLSKINSFWGLIGQEMDTKNRIIYGLTEEGHLVRYFIVEDYTEDMGRVDNWDICRTLLIDDNGNVYGSYSPGLVWKYDFEQDRIFNLEFLRLPISLDSRTMANPMLDRRAQWRYIEWDPVDKVAYGVIGGNNMLFKYDVDKGLEGEITPLTKICAPMYRDGHPYDIPHSTLGMTINKVNRKVYFLPVIGGDFDYGLIKQDIDKKSNPGKGSGKMPPLSFLVSYDLESGTTEDMGLLRAKDGRYAYGTGAADTDRDGKIWFVGAFEEPNPEYEVRKMSGKFPYSMGLGCYDPMEKSSQIQ